MSSLGRNTVDTISSSPNPEIRKTGKILSEIENTIKDGALWIGATAACLSRPMAPLLQFLSGTALGVSPLIAEIAATETSHVMLDTVLATMPFQVPLLLIAGSMVAAGVGYGINKAGDEIFKKIDQINPDIIPKIREQMGLILNENGKDRHNLFPGTQDQGMTGQYNGFWDAVKSSLHSLDYKSEKHEIQPMKI